MDKNKMPRSDPIDIPKIKPNKNIDIYMRNFQYEYEEYLKKQAEQPTRQVRKYRKHVY